MENKCLYCYKKLSDKDMQSDAGKSGFHESCSKSFFGKKVPPILDFEEKDILEFATNVVMSQKTVTGVQPKLSIGLSQNLHLPERFTIIGLLGEYILKPQTDLYNSLPENEDLTMHLAQISKLKTVDHSLIRMKSGQLAYITKREDRNEGKKHHMEDMCQLTERLTEHKYKGSYEQIAKAIARYAANAGLHKVDFFELVLFSFLVGNNDMHLKNFSLLKTNGEYNLSPAYDLLSSALVVEDDDEELALTLNGKKKNLKRKDFETAMIKSGIDPKVVDNVFKKYRKLKPTYFNLINQSFLSDELKEAYISLMNNRYKQLEML